MKDFKVQFSISPYLLLLIIPCVLLTLFLYLRLEKRYRRTKNRIISIILHTIVSVLCICVLSGMFFSWEMPNVENELVLLVDASYSEQQSNSRINSFVKEILDSNGNRSRIAIVTFGYDQVLALEMGDYSADRAYDRYLKAERPDTSATDIAAALKFVYDPLTGKSGGDGDPIIEHPESARILLLSDGLQTDEDALSVARRISMEGVHVDTSFFPGSNASDVWITGVTQPDRKFSIGESFEYGLNLRSNYEGVVSFALYDNNQVAYENQGTTLSLGEQTVKIPHMFTSPGHHELKFTISSEGDSLTLNNEYYSYYELEEYSRILIIEKYADESKQIVQALKDQNPNEYMEINVVEIGNTDKVPQSIEMMQEYDEIVLVNIAYADMPEHFEENLNTYVKERGGGLFTVGGVKRDSRGQVMTQTQNNQTVPLTDSYNKSDLEQSKYYQSMLPVEAVDFTPPVALVIIIDCSGSMANEEKNGFSLIDYAVNGALGCLDILSPRDYVGVMMMEDTYKVGLDMTPMTQKQKIITAIRRIADSGGGGTYYASAIDHAGRALSTVDVEKKHILVISDGQPGDTLTQEGDFPGYGNIMKRYHDNDGVTITVVSIDTAVSGDLIRLAEIGGGSAFMLRNSEMGQMKTRVQLDLSVTEVSGAIPMDYIPTISTTTSILSGITQSDLNGITMHGSFATRAKSKGDVVVTLMADIVPLYAQWDYGHGKVGSFLCDLNGYWSEEFLAAEIGPKIVNNIITGMIPMMDIRAHTLDATFIEDNYHTQVSIYGYSQKDTPNSKLVAIIEPPDGSGPEKYDLSDLSLSGNRFTFENRAPGVHSVTILQVPKNFDIFNSKYQSSSDIPNSQIQGILKTYRVFSYSEEYDPTLDPYSTGKNLLIRMSSRQVDSEYEDDKLIEDPDEFLSVFINEYHSWDPRMWFIGISVVLFLIDVAVRKFKFKWPHQLLQKKA